jgi:phytoene dehydrogenase-like protein
MTTSSAPVAIIGAGVSGLACAVHLHEAGVPTQLFEASDRAGGRVRTDLVDGFRIDRGFQVLQTAYPEVRALLDLEALRLGRFTPGARIRLAGRFESFVDPSRRLRELPGLVGSPVMRLADQLRVATFRLRTTAGSLERLYARGETSALERLHEQGFSQVAIERFFRPFFAGVFLERELASSSRFLEFAFRHFALGDAALPAEGMGAIPRQLAGRLPAGAIHVNAPVESLERHGLRVGGAHVDASAVVIATDGEAARDFLPALPTLRHNGTACLSFAADADPVGAPILLLDAERSGPLNHVCVPSAVAASYAPAGQALVSASVIGIPLESDAELASGARKQLRMWFGTRVDAWRLIRIDRVPRALPRQLPGWLEPVEREVRLGPRTFVCGDHRDMGSLHGALRAGRRAAAAVISELHAARERHSAATSASEQEIAS